MSVQTSRRFTVANTSGESCERKCRQQRRLRRASLYGKVQRSLNRKPRYIHFDPERILPHKAGVASQKAVITWKRQHGEFRVRNILESAWVNFKKVAGSRIQRSPPRWPQCSLLRIHLQARIRVHEWAYAKETELASNRCSWGKHDTCRVAGGLGSATQARACLRAPSP